MNPNYHQKPLERMSVNLIAGNSNVDVLDSGLVGIQSGDFLHWASGSSAAKSANTLTWTTDKVTTQIAFAKAFIGVAEGANSKDKPARLEAVTVSGIHTLKVAADTYAVGDLLGVAKQAGGNALERATLEKVTNPEAAIARVVEATAAGATSALGVLITRLLGHFQEDAIGSVSFSVAAENSNSVTVTGQVKDRFGNNLAGVRSFMMWLASTATGGVTGTAPSGAVTAVTGVLAAITAKTHHYVTTESDGSFSFTIAETGTNNWYLRALAGGKISTSAVTAFS